MNDKAAELFLDALLVGASNAIELQEARGQSELVASTNLPKKGDWEKLQEMGIIKGENIDKLFCSATLPEGWSKVRTDHSMWSELKDSRGLKRASIFYKAAFYDEDAHINCVSNRFVLSQYHEKCDEDGVQFVVNDLGLDKAIQIFDPAYYATLDGVLGVIHGGKFYSKTSDSVYDAVFIDDGIDAEGSKKLTKDEFYEIYHNRDVSRYDLIKAIEELAKRDALAFVETLPKDESQWTEAFDFPEI